MALNTRTATLVSEIGIPLVFPVPPLGTTIDYVQNTKSLNILGWGEVVYSGEKKLQRLNFSSFFPSLDSPFYNVFKNPSDPTINLLLLNSWKDSGETLTFVVPESATLMYCIITSITEEERDFTNDRYFSISLVEVRPVRTFSSKITGLKIRS